MEDSRFNLSAAALRHRQLTLFFLVAIAIGGVAAYFTLGQREDPDFAFRAMVIRTLWPGATAEQVDRQITDRIEKKLQETPHFKWTQSYSKPGESLIVLELLDTAPAIKVPEYWYQVRKKIGDIRHTLPPEALGPFFNDEFGDVYGSIYAFSADGFTHSELRDYVERARQEVLRLPNVAKVELIGVQDDRIYVELSSKRLGALGIDPQMIGQALAAQNAVASPGSVETAERSVALRVTGQLDSVSAVSDLLLRAAGQTFRLGDVARVERGYADPPVTTMRVRGRPSIGLAVSMTRNGDVLRLGEDLKATMARLRAEFPVGIEFEQVSDQPRVVQAAVGEFMRSLLEAVAIVLAVSMTRNGDVLRLGEDLKATMARLRAEFPVGIEFEQVSDQPRVVQAAVGEFMRSLLEAVAIVLAVSFLSLGLRTGLVVALTIPLVLAAIFLAMRWFDIDLHRVSTGALIISLGLLVDDAMIAVEMMARKLEEGYDKLRAATYAYTSTAFPMLSGTLITAAGFLPIATAKSATGEYTFSIFAVTTLALVISWFAAVIATPFIGSLLLREHPVPEGAGPRDVYDKPFYRRLRATIDWCIVHRKTVLAATGATLALGIAGMGLTEKQFFPSSNRVELMADLWLPEGASIRATEREAARVERLLEGDPDIASYVTYVGNGSPRFFLSLEQQLFRTNFAQVIVLTRDVQARERVIAKLRRALAEDFPGVRGRATRVPLGPPVSYPVQFRVMGDDPARLKTIAERVAERMRANPHTVDVNLNWGDRVLALRVDLDQDQARALGASSLNVSRAVAAVVSGVTIGQYRENDRLIDVVLRAPAEERGSLAALGELSVPTAGGRSVPLAQLARVEEVLEEPILWRRSRQLTLTARADIVDGVQAPDVTAAITPGLDEIRRELPPGYRIESGGAWEENTKAQSAIAAGLPMMLVVILALLMMQMRTFSRSFMVLLTWPLGIIGVAIALLVFGKPFGFVAMLGTIALGGMIMRNTVILVDQIEQDRTAGAPDWIAIREATVRRFRPITLTAAAAMLAMIPLARSVLWGPMAYAIMGGLLVATVLTLLFVPALYAAWFRVKRPDADVRSAAAPQTGAGQ